MKIVFFGTPNYVVPIVDALHKSFRNKVGENGVVAVVTQKPMPVGRKQILEYSPVDTWAHKKEIPIYFDAGKLITDKISADVGVLASYGALIPQEVINYFPNGIIVIHPSLLPEFRWASPIPGAIVFGTNPTGVSFIKMDDKWDHGPIITSFKEDILPDDTTGKLRERLFLRSAEVLVNALPAYIGGKIKLKPQDDSHATYARMIKKEDGYIPGKYLNACMEGKSLKTKWKIDFIKDFSLVPDANLLERFIRAMDPWPVAWTEVKLGSDEVIKRLKILKAHVEKQITNAYCLVPDLVQLEGKDPVSWKQFTEGYSDYSF